MGRASAISNSSITAPTSQPPKRGRPDNLARFGAELVGELECPIVPLEFARLDDPDWFKRTYTLIHNLRHGIRCDVLGLPPAMVDRAVANLKRLADMPVGKRFVTSSVFHVRVPNLKLSGIQRGRAEELSGALLAVTQEDPVLVRRAVLGYMYAVDHRMYVLLNSRQYAWYGHSLIAMVKQMIQKLNSPWLTFRLSGFEVDDLQGDLAGWRADLGVEPEFPIPVHRAVNSDNRAELDHLRIDVGYESRKFRLSRAFHEVLILAAVTDLWRSVRSDSAPLHSQRDQRKSDGAREDCDSVEELRATVRSLTIDREAAIQRADEQGRRAADLERRLHTSSCDNQQLRAELELLRNGRYGPRAERIPKVSTGGGM